MKVKSEVAQLCPTLCDPMDCSLPGFYVRGIFQARVLEWGTIAFSTLHYWGEYKLVQPLWKIEPYLAERDRERERNKFSQELNGIPLQYSCLENPMDGGAW